MKLINIRDSAIATPRGMMLLKSDSHARPARAARCVHWGVLYTRQPRPGRDSHSICSRRRRMRRLGVGQQGGHFDEARPGIAHLTVPLQKLESLRRSQRLSFGQSRCSS